MKESGRISRKEKVAIAIFITVVPRLIELWKKHKPNVTFDIFLQEVMLKAKAKPNEYLSLLFKEL